MTIRRGFFAVLLLASALCSVSQVWAQASGNANPLELQVGVRYAGTRANSPPGRCGCFLLQGGAVDAALPLVEHLSAALEVTGNHAGFVPETSRELSTIALLAGPRYTMQFGRRHAILAQALFGAVRGFDAEFRRGDNAADTATAFSYALGGAYEFRLTHSLSIRPVQVDLLQTNLPNGADNSQRNLRFGAGVSFTVPLGITRR